MGKRRVLSERIKYGILILFVSSFYMFNTSALSGISVIFFAGVLFLIHCFQRKGIIQIPRTAFWKMGMAFAFFCISSAVWAKNSAASVSKGVTVAEIVLCMSIVFLCYLEENSSRDLLRAIKWSGAVICVYSIYYYGSSKFLAMVLGTLRIGNDYANANAIGMWAAISVILYIYFILKEGIYLSDVTIVLPLALVAMSQSRTALIETVAGVLLIVFFRYRDREHFFKGVLKVFFALCIVLGIIVLLAQMEAFSGMRERMISLIDYSQGKQVREGSAIQRSLYIHAGLEQFKKTPLIGIGIGNTNEITQAVTGHNSYLHNNFVELLASGGIIGFSIYYSITGYLLIKLLPYAMKKDSVSDICVIVLLVHTLSDYGTVSYYTKNTYYIFATCFLQVYLNQMRGACYEPE